jgi:BASS family bile acid:Na+ symporter
MSIQDVFTITVVIFTVANLAAMGLELNLRDALRTLRSARAIGLILLWGWVVGPALAYLITRVLPLAEAHAAGLLLISLAPTAPFFPLMVRKARGDMSFAGAVMLLTTLGTVLFLPLLAPLLIEGLTVDAWSLAKPLLMMVLLPLLIGGAIREFAPNAAEKLFPVVKKIGGIFLVLTLVLTLVLYGRDMLGAVGSFAPGAQVLFFAAITALSYKIGFGLEQQQRSGMALGMCTRNIAAVFAAYFGITNPPAGLFVMIVLVVPLALIVAMVAARLFARQVPKGEADIEQSVPLSEKRR